MAQTKAAFLQGLGERQMDIRFQILTILRTINTKPPKIKHNTKLLQTKAVFCLLLAVLFFPVSIYHFWKVQDIDGILFLALTALCVSGAFLVRRLSRQGAVSLLFCVILLGIVVCSTLRGSSHILMMMWGLFLPAVAIGLCGIKYGSIAGGLLVPYFFVLFYTPLADKLPTAYPVEVRIFYPILYTVTYAAFFMFSYYQHKQLLAKHQSEQTLEKAVSREYDKVMAMTTQTILSISNAVDARDAYTKRHSSRVAEYSVLLAKSLGWDSRRTEQLYNIALLHDIGKIGVSDSILNKHAALTDEEYEAIKQHTVIGGEILKDLTLLPNASIGAVSHHEKYDGTGYPYGLKGSQIPLEARIIGIADAFDAMNSSRVYRSKMLPKTILEELQAGRGCQFDPELLDKFLPIAEQLLESNVM